MERTDQGIGQQGTTRQNKNQERDITGKAILAVVYEKHLPVMVAYVSDMEQAEMFLYKQVTDRLALSDMSGVADRIRTACNRDKNFCASTDYFGDIKISVNVLPTRIFGRDVFFLVERCKSVQPFGHAHIFFNELIAVDAFMDSADEYDEQIDEIFFVHFSIRDDIKPIVII